MLALTPSVQSPRAYDRANLQKPQLLERVGDDGFRYVIHPRETDAGLVTADLTFGFDPGDFRRYGADLTGAADSTDAINACILANRASVAPEGAYRVDGTILVAGGHCVRADKGAVFTRGGAGTDPLLTVIDSYSAWSGGEFHTANASPGGVVVLGHLSPTDSRNAWWWRFTDCDVYLRQNAASDIGVYVPSCQVNDALLANYFGFIQNINIEGGDVQMYLPELANAHNISNVQFWAGRTCGLRLRGAYANNISHVFFHAAVHNGYVAIQLQNQVDAGGQHDSIFNQITGWTSETTNALDKSLEVESGCNLNVIVGGSNVLNGWTISNDQNFIVINGDLLTSPSLRTQGNLTVGGDSSIAGKQTIGSAIQPAIPPTTGITSGAGTGAGAATTIIPSTLLAIQQATLVLVNIKNTNTNNNLARSDLLLLQMRNNAHSSSTVEVVKSSFTTSGTDGEPSTATYTLSFADGNLLPKLQVAITSINGPQTFTAECTLVRV